MLRATGSITYFCPKIKLWPETLILAWAIFFHPLLLVIARSLYTYPIGTIPQKLTRLCFTLITKIIPATPLPRRSCWSHLHLPILTPTNQLNPVAVMTMMTKRIPRRAQVQNRRRCRSISTQGAPFLLSSGASWRRGVPSQYGITTTNLWTRLKPTLLWFSLGRQGAARLLRYVYMYWAEEMGTVGGK